MRSSSPSCRESSLALLLAVVVSVGGLCLSPGVVAQVPDGGEFWDVQSNMTDGGPGQTQQAAAENWFTRFGNQFWFSHQDNPCGVLGSSGYRFCPINDFRGSAEAIDD